MSKRLIFLVLWFFIFNVIGLAFAEEEIVAEVNGERISRAQLETRLNELGKEPTEENVKIALQATIEEKLIEQEAERRGIFVYDDEVYELKTAKERLTGRTDLSNREVHTTLLKRKLMAEISGESIIDGEAEAYFNERRMIPGAVGLQEDANYQDVAEEIKGELLEAKAMNAWTAWFRNYEESSQIKAFLKPGDEPEEKKEETSGLIKLPRFYTASELKIEAEPETVLAWAYGRPFVYVEEYNRRLNEFPQAAEEMSLSEARYEIISNIVNEKLLAKKAQEMGLVEKEEVAKELAKAKKEVLEIAEFERLDYRGVRDEEARDYYENNLEEFRMPDKNTKGKFIVKNTEAETKEVLKKLKEGQEFDSFAFRYLGER